MRTVGLCHRGFDRPPHLDEAGRRLAAIAICAVLLIDGSWAAEGELQVPESFEACTACHSYERDEPLLEGPPLWGVIGRRVASVEGYEYSSGLRAIGGVWDRSRLDRFLSDPKVFAPGTKMDMGGVRNAAERADVLDFLELLSPQKPTVSAGE
jgi:cytochrome c